MKKTDQIRTHFQGWSKFGPLPKIETKVHTLYFKKFWMTVMTYLRKVHANPNMDAHINPLFSQKSSKYLKLCPNKILLRALRSLSGSRCTLIQDGFIFIVFLYAVCPTLSPKTPQKSGLNLVQILVLRV